MELTTRNWRYIFAAIRNNTNNEHSFEIAELSQLMASGISGSETNIPSCSAYKWLPES